MNKQETAAVLVYFGAAFPNMDITHDTADVWAFELNDIDPDVAPEAMRNVAKESEFPPTIAKFREACRVVAYRRRTERTPPALPPGDPDPMPSEMVTRLRSQIAEWTAGGVAQHRVASPESTRGLPIPPTRCPRCGQNTLPYTATLEPKEVEPMAPYSEEPA